MSSITPARYGGSSTLELGSLTVTRLLIGWGLKSLFCIKYTIQVVGVPIRLIRNHEEFYVSGNIFLKKVQSAEKVNV